MKILLTGGTGFIGIPLMQRLLGEGHQVVLLSRNPENFGVAANGSLMIERWDGKSSGFWAEQMNSIDGVINLAGEPIGLKRWNNTIKAAIRNSRIEATQVIVEAISQSTVRPKVLINASAVGFYGDVPLSDVDETIGRGRGFLAETCELWEHRALAAKKQGVRVTLLRTGIALEKDGGVLARMMVPFKAFAGGPPGTGRQWISWIHRDDVIEAILFILKNDGLEGPINITAPEPATMRDFCQILARTIGRPSWAPVPEIVLKAMLGEMSEMLLTGQRALPRKLLEAGFIFKYPNLEGAFKAIFRK